MYATARGNQLLRSPQIILLYMDYTRWIPAQVHESGDSCTMRSQAMEGGEPARIAKEIPVLLDSKATKEPLSSAIRPLPSSLPLIFLG